MDNFGDTLNEILKNSVVILPKLIKLVVISRLLSKLVNFFYRISKFYLIVLLQIELEFHWKKCISTDKSISKNRVVE